MIGKNYIFLLTSHENMTKKYPTLWFHIKTSVNGAVNEEK